MKAYLRVRCNKEFLAVIRDFVKSHLRNLQVDGPDSHQIVLAVDEACANCMIHQHQCDDYSMIEVAIYREGHTLYTEIKDTGKAFPIDTYRPQSIDEIVKQGGNGGLGINLIHRFMDEIKVEEKSDYYIYRFGKHISQTIA